MRCVIIGLGNQGKKRLRAAAADVVDTVDPIAAEAGRRRIEDIPLDRFDAACVCTPDEAKLPLLRYLLENGKHVLVEKPLLDLYSPRPPMGGEGLGARGGSISREKRDPLTSNPSPPSTGERGDLRELVELARRKNAVCYTAYNHRFEPHIVRIGQLLRDDTIGRVYSARFFYGNGTARDVRGSWRDRAPGVLADLGSHLLDLTLYLFGKEPRRFELWDRRAHENQAWDHCLFGSVGQPSLHYEVSLLSWKNTFSIDILGEKGSLHVNGLCKWGPSRLTVRKRVLPSGAPAEQVHTIARPDPTWRLEHEHFKRLCLAGTGNFDNDLWIQSALEQMTRCVERKAA